VFIVNVFLSHIVVKTLAVVYELGYNAYCMTSTDLERRSPFAYSGRNSGACTHDF